MNSKAKKAQKGREARTDARVGHGPEGGALINALTETGRHEKELERGRNAKKRSRGTWTRHLETAGHQHPQAAVIRMFYYTLRG
jgi:hypothetical protein